jgi:hypothetical protein
MLILTCMTTLQGMPLSIPLAYPGPPKFEDEPSGLLKSPELAEFPPTKRNQTRPVHESDSGGISFFNSLVVSHLSSVFGSLLAVPAANRFLNCRT